MKKAWHIIKSVLIWAILIAAIGMMIFTIFSVITFDQTNRSLFGYKFFIVQSDSMSATDFSAGDIIFVKSVNPATLQAGDVIAFISKNQDSYGKIVTHKIRRLTTNVDGAAVFVTYGTTTDIDDETVVTYSNVLGKYVGKLPKLGRFFAFLKTTRGYFLCILVPFVLLIGYNVLNCVLLFGRYKREQMEEELQVEKKKLEEERRQFETMKKELEELRLLLVRSGETTNQTEETSKRE